MDVNLPCVSEHIRLPTGADVQYNKQVSISYSGRVTDYKCKVYAKCYKFAIVMNVTLNLRKSNGGTGINLPTARHQSNFSTGEKL